MKGECAKARGGGVRRLCGGFLLENRGGMFHETVRTACGKGRFAVTIKARMKARPTKVLSGGTGCRASRERFLPNVTRVMPRTSRVWCGSVWQQVRHRAVAASAVSSAERQMEGA